uniref:SFRICE_032253 n=1 Tax=Spodoptera frugiperda TaxID=7108 RepID=A0A2H1VSG2_SPOFR
MSLRSKALALVEVLLRVPPLFVVDEFLKISLGLPVSSGEEGSVLANITVDGVAVDMMDSDVNYYDANFYNALFFTIVKFLVCCLGEENQSKDFSRLERGQTLTD